MTVDVGPSCCAGDLREVEVALAAPRVVGGEVRVDLLADLVAAAAGARADRGGDRADAADLPQRLTPSAMIPPASGFQPQCSAATAPSAASRTGRQSATKTIAAASSSAVAWPSSSV